jgi:hypothetical protein
MGVPGFPGFDLLTALWISRSGDEAESLSSCTRFSGTGVNVGSRACFGSGSLGWFLDLWNKWTMLAVALVISSSETKQIQSKESFALGGTFDACDFLVIVICARYMQGSRKSAQLLATRN